MVQYILCGFVTEAVRLPPDAELHSVELRLGHGAGAWFRAASSRISPTGTCCWDEEFRQVLDLQEGAFEESALHVEVFSRGGCWQRLLAAGRVRLSWIQGDEGHFHPRLAVPLKPRGELHLALCVMGPGDAAPVPDWLSRFVAAPYAPATKPPNCGKRASQPRGGRLEFTMVGIWDLILGQ
ncbi:unnamed protein product, partial [Effrenium voratum]